MVTITDYKVNQNRMRMTNGNGWNEYDTDLAIEA